LYDVVPAKFGQGERLVTRASHYGKGKSRHSDFLTAAISTRFGRDIEFGASLDTGRTAEDLCFVVDAPGAVSATSPLAGPQVATTINGQQTCRIVTPFRGQTEIKLHWVYPLPAGFTVSGIFENLSGVPYEANYTVSNADIVPSLGRNLAACGTRPVCTATATVPLIVPRTQFEPRRTNLDLRVSKVFSVGPKTRLRANLDVYNVLNDSSVLQVNNTYGPFWRQPGGTLAGGLMVSRLIQFGGQLTF
jgi:hypothetical protein